MTAAAILGAGQMGRGIAAVCAMAGTAADIYDSDSAAVASAKEKIAADFSRLVRKKIIPQKKADDAVARIHPRKSLGKWIGGADFVIEAIAEDFSAKRKLFARVAALIKPGAVMASNTSSLSLTKLADGFPRPSRTVGMHFMNPPTLMPLVEIIRGEKTADKTIARVVRFAEKLGKRTIIAADRPGFATNRLLMPLINEAAFALDENVADAESIDLAMHLGMRHPMGPLALADLIGLDTCLSVLQILESGIGDKFRPCPLLIRLVESGKLGRKSGEGFYKY